MDCILIMRNSYSTQLRAKQVHPFLKQELRGKFCVSGGLCCFSFPTRSFSQPYVITLLPKVQWSFTQYFFQTFQNPSVCSLQMHHDRLHWALFLENPTKDNIQQLLLSDTCAEKIDEHVLLKKVKISAFLSCSFVLINLSTTAGLSRGQSRCQPVLTKLVTRKGG